MSSRSYSPSLIVVTDEAPSRTAHTAKLRSSASGYRNPRGLRGSGTADNACSRPTRSPSVTGRAGVSVGVVTADSAGIGHADIAGEVLEVVWDVENS
jgi:hypothetical protein